jgi:ferritin
MVNSSKRSTTSLELLISEIEATPREYWTELLETLRQFRQTISSTTSPIINAEQAQKNQTAINLLDSWLSEDEDASEHQQTWNYLKKAMDEDRLSDRLLFP